MMRIDLGPALTWSLAIALSGVGVYLWLLVITAIVKVASAVQSHYAMKRKIASLVLGIVQPEESERSKPN